MTIQIKQVSLDEVRHISRMAAKEILPFKSSYDIYALRVQGFLVAVASLYRPSKHTVRFAGDFTLPEYRGLGYGLMLAEHRWELIQTDPQYSSARIVDCFAMRPDWFLSKGFVAVRQYRQTTYVRYTGAAQGTR